MKYDIIKLSNFVHDKTLFDFYFHSIYSVTKQLNLEYPRFHDWYYETIKNGLLEKEREILFILLDYYIAGIAILKNSSIEKKICTLRVVDRFQRLGIGKYLLLKSFEYLDTEFPLITVSSSKDYQFRKLFRYFNFKKESELPNYYLPNSKEITYNGILI